MPRTRTGRIIATFAVVAAVFLLGTLLALEGHEVVILRTFAPNGTPRETRVWIADADGVAWIESANEDRPFFRDILQNPDVEVVRNAEVERLHAEPILSADGHPKIRRLLSEKYGWADCWIGLLADTSNSIAIRLVAPKTQSSGIGRLRV